LTEHILSEANTNIVKMTNMSESKRKFLSEFALNMYSARWLITTADQIASGGVMDHDEQEISDICHIYLISKSPALSFSKEMFSYKSGVISGDVTYSINGKARELPFSQKFPLLDGAVSIGLSDFPHREIQTFDDNGKLIRHLPAHVLCMGHGMHIENPELHNLEVLYIGQAYGDGSRSAFERLRSHSTLQKILAESQYRSPESAINILTFEYLPYRLITQMDGVSKVKFPDHDDKARFMSILENPLTEHQQVCLIEAALIRYFRPHYNEIYKESFPSQNHKILESCYELDFSGLVVEIDTEDLYLQLFSDHAKPKWHHICQFDLVDDEDRWGFFHFTFENGETIKMPDVISGK